MADVAVLGASGYAGALTAQLLWRHPFFELSTVTSRSDAGRRLDDLHPRYRVPLELEAGAVVPALALPDPPPPHADMTRAANASGARRRSGRAGRMGTATSFFTPAGGGKLDQLDQDT